MRRRSQLSGLSKNALASAVAAAFVTGGIGAAYGQDDVDDENQQVEAGEDARVEEDIIVTGTRIRRDDFSAPTATTVIDAEDMRNLGVISVADMVNQLPNNIASTSPEAGVESPYNVGASVANLRGLNTFFGTRTLTLVNNRRMVSTTNSGAVDMNMIPSAMVGRIETVTGGASATYGADAMAGVVNVIMDDNIEDVTVELGYQTTAEGDGDRYNFSIATGVNVFDGRGNFSIGVDLTDQAGIDDCTTRDYCRANRALTENGGGSNAPYTPRDDDVLFGPDTPQFFFTEGNRFTTPTSGMVWEDPFETDPTSEVWRFTDDGRDVMPYLTGLAPEEYDYIRDQSFGRNGFSPFLTEATGGKMLYEDQPMLPESQRENLRAAFTYDLDSGISLDTSISYGATENIALQNNPRDQMTSFCVRPGNAYLDDRNPTGASEQMRQVVYSRMYPGYFTYPDDDRDGHPPPNPLYDPTDTGVPNPGWPFTGAGPTFLAYELTATAVDDEPYLPDAGSFSSFTLPCIDVPYLGGSFLETSGEFGGSAGTAIRKDMSDQLNRRNIRTADTTQFEVGATGDLFEGGSWTWDTYWTYGKTNTLTHIQQWRSDNRFEMAADTVWDPAANGGQGAAVCRINASPGWAPRPASHYIDYGLGYIDPDLTLEWVDGVGFFGAPAAVAAEGPNGEQPWPEWYLGDVDEGILPGELTSQEYYDEWLRFQRISLEAEFQPQLEQLRSGFADPNGPEADAAVDAAFGNFIEAYVDRTAEGCVPFNPFGNQPISQELIDYAFPSINEGSEITQNVTEINFSGEIFSGIGAGPWQMAAGLTWREEETRNFNEGDPLLGRDFSALVGGAFSDESNIGTGDVAGEAYAVFGDNWQGVSTNTEAFVEFDFPLLRDKKAADELTLNIANRRTRNESERIEGSIILDVIEATRYNDSWSSRLSWQPVDVMRMRVTRSTDTRAPSAQELFQTNTPAQNAGGELEQRRTNFDFSRGTLNLDIINCADGPDDDDEPECTNPDGTFLAEDADFYDMAQAGNAGLSSERSITETFGLVFQPLRTVPGLSASIDYYETTVRGGIERQGLSDVIVGCEQFLLGQSANELPCNQIQFGDPEGNGAEQLWDPVTAEQYVDADPNDDLVVDGNGDLWLLQPVDNAPPEIPVLPDGDRLEVWPYSNITSVTTTNVNVNPYWSRGIDFSIEYGKQLAGGGELSGRALVTRFLEQSIVSFPCAFTGVEVGEPLPGFATECSPPSAQDLIDAEAEGLVLVPTADIIGSDYDFNDSQGGFAGFFDTSFGIHDVSGQTGANGLAFSPGQILTTNYSPTPRISGNLFMTYRKNAFSLTSQLRYIGTGRLFKQEEWIGPGEAGWYYVDSAIYNPAEVVDDGGTPDPADDITYDSWGAATLDQLGHECSSADGDSRAPETSGWLSCRVPYDPSLNRTVQDSTLPSWATLNVNVSYDFGLSRFSMDRFQSLQVYLNIENVADRVPDFYSGNGAGGINTVYFSGLGRQYNMGVRMTF